MSEQSLISEQLAQLAASSWRPLDHLPYQEIPEKLLALALNGLPDAPPQVVSGLAGLAATLRQEPCSEVRVVVLGGGTGLSNIVGGDSRHPAWPTAPFSGLKSVFPRLISVVCVTDDGGSTGELLRDLPLLAVGDLRHVLLSSILRDKLQQQYELSAAEALATTGLLHRLFNCRFTGCLPANAVEVLEHCGVKLTDLPPFMARSLFWLIDEIFSNPHLQPLRKRSHCLGNLLLVAAIYQQPAMKMAEIDAASPLPPPPAAIMGGLRFLADLLGASPEAVLPCTTTPASLKVLYDNGVLVSGELKSALARRNCPVNRVFVEFADSPEIPSEVFAAIAEADIILFAPGSLFTSLIPILRVPGLAAALRQNNKALKLLLANLWVQAGETDLVTGEWERRYHVSDLLRAYRRNIPGGIAGLFEQVLVVGMREIPGSILQSYALENKVPIYLDRKLVRELGLTPLEAAISSQYDLAGERVVQHDPEAVAVAVRTLWASRFQSFQSPPSPPQRSLLPPSPSLASRSRQSQSLRQASRSRQAQSFHQPQSLPRTQPLTNPLINPRRQTLNARYRQFRQRLAQLDFQADWLPFLTEIFWWHRDILWEHLDQVAGMQLVAVNDWRRCQEWDNVFSFYDPVDRMIKVRADIAPGHHLFEVAFLVALGQSLLGNYAAAKAKVPVQWSGGEEIGYIFSLTMRPAADRRSFFSTEELESYLELARMRQARLSPLLFTRVINGREGFTPPGLLFGLIYAWYLDNRFVPSIEYKISITKAQPSDLVPEQTRITQRCQGLINFFRQRVFRSHPQTS